MLYFILWTIFLLAVILAVPIVNWLENKQRREALEPSSAEEEASEDEVAEEQAEEEFEGEEPVEVGTEEFGGDDFSAFEEEFK